MISTGLPELSSEKDLNYLRETLVSTFNNLLLNTAKSPCFLCRYSQKQMKKP